jgi:hypothetical protein
MRTEIRYIELKTGFSDNGPAWISKVAFSTSGRTVYFNNKAFQRIRGCAGNFIDIETGEEYWISGLKRTGSNRHWAGNGKIQLDRTLENEYLRITNQTKIDQGKISLVDILEEYPVERIKEKLNR